MAKQKHPFALRYSQERERKIAQLKEVKEDLPTGPKEFWAYLNKKGFFQSKWGNENPEDETTKPWQPYPEQWDFYDWYQQQGNGLNMMLAMRNIAKSEILTIFDTVYKIAHNHSHSIVIARANITDACDFVFNCYKMLKACNVAIEKYSYKEGIYLYGSVDKEPVLRPLSTQQGFRGKHPREVKIDDPIGENHANSIIFRKRALDFVQAILNSDSNKQLKVLVIGQYVHPDDLFCYYKKRGAIPIYEAWIKQLGHLVQVNKEEYLKSNSLFNWGCNYEGYPNYAQDDAIFANARFTADKVLSWDYDIAIIDPAFTETKTSDFTALVLIKQIGKIYVVYLFCWHTKVYDVIGLIANKIKKYNINYVYYEGVDNEPIGEKLELHGVASSYFNSLNSKERRIRSIQSLIHDNLYIHTDSDEDAIDQFVRWTKFAEHDDVPDATSLGINALIGNSQYISFKS